MATKINLNGVETILKRKSVKNISKLTIIVEERSKAKKEKDK